MIDKINANSIKSVIGLFRVKAWPSFMLCFFSGLFWKGVFSPNPITEVSLIEIFEVRYYLSVIGFALLLGYTFAINQCFDIKEDKLHVEKNRLPIVSGKMALSTAFVWTTIFLTVGLISIFSVSKTPQVVLLFVLFSTVYSIPKLRFKEQAGLDLVSNGAFGGLSFLMGTSIKSFIDLNSIFIGTIITLIYGLGYILHSCADYETDKLAGVKTTCVRIGKRRSLLLATVLSIVTSIVFIFGVILFQYATHYLVLSVFSLILIIIIAKTKINNSKSLVVLQKRAIYLGYFAGLTALMLYFFS